MQDDGNRKKGETIIFAVLGFSPREMKGRDSNAIPAFDSMSEIFCIKRLYSPVFFLSKLFSRRDCLHQVQTYI
jgi:hypothetical protein